MTKQTKPQFKQQTIEIVTHDGTRIPIKARVYKGIAVHNHHKPANPRHPGRMVTHAQSGRSILPFGFDLMSEAEEAAIWLADQADWDRPESELDANQAIYVPLITAVRRGQHKEQTDARII